MRLYKHVNNKDVAVEVLKFIDVPGKDYAKIKVCWWNIGPHEPYCMNMTQWLTDASIDGSMKDRKKYSLKKWREEWELL